MAKLLKVLKEYSVSLLILVVVIGLGAAIGLSSYDYHNPTFKGNISDLVFAAIGLYMAIRFRHNAKVSFISSDLYIFH